MVGTLTADGLTLGSTEIVTIGTGTMTHDGTDMVFNDVVEATGFKPTTTLTECVMLDASAINCTDCATADVTGTNFDYTTADFDSGATEEKGSWSFELPANFAAGSAISVTFTWMSNNAACNAGATADVCWAIDGDSFANDAAFHGGALGGTAVGVTDNCLANGDIMLTPAVSFATHSMVAGERAVVQVFRDTDGTNCAATAANDDLAADASLLAVRFCYEVDNVFSGE
jgi:hypothetical protein